MRLFRLSILLIALIPALGAAQSNFGTLNLETKIGAFKIKRYNLVSPAEGKIEISFNGTLLISGYQGKAFEPTMKGLHIEFPAPSVLKDYTRQNFEKIVLQGKGSVVLDGSFMAIQWLGRDLKAKWHGRGVIYLFAEFDENEQTGKYWFSDPKKAKFWPTPNINLEIPNAELGLGGRGSPQARPKGGGGTAKPTPKKPGG